MHHYILLFGFILLLIAFIYYYRQTNTIKTGVDYQTHVLKLCILLALTLNFGVAYYTSLDNGFTRLSRAMLDSDKIVFDMGATSLGWIIYEFNHLFFITDSWWFIAQALDYIEQHPSGLVYQELFFNQHLKFQYPTTSLLFFDFIRSNTVYELGTLFSLFNFISIVTLPFLAWFCYNLYYRENIPTFFIEKLSDIKQFSTLFGFFGLTLLFYPIIISIYLGQVQTWIVVLVAWAILCFSQQKYVMSGVLLAICTTIKPQWALIFIWAALRKQWSMFFSGIIILLLAVTLAIILYGANNFFDYLNTLTFLSQHGESYFANQSINGLMHRLLQNGVIDRFLPGEFPPYNATVYFTTIISSILIISFALFWRVNKKPTDIDLSIIILAATVASPVAWNHHYGVLLPIFSLAFYYTQKLRPFGKQSLLFLLVCYGITSQNFDPITYKILSSPWNFMQSTMLFGVMFFFYILCVISLKNDNKT